MNVKSVANIDKKIFNVILKLKVFIHFLPDLLKGRLSVSKFTRFLKRLLFFLSKLQDNKFIKFGKYTRVNLYVPGVPSKAFYFACGKFKTFDGQFPNTTALISVTSACHFNCEHCYQRKDLGKDMDISKLVEIVKHLQNIGVAFFNIEGGEPFLVYERLKKVCEVIDDRSEVWINSTGDGMTVERLQELKTLNLTAVMFSLHSSDPAKLNSFMKSDKAWQTMEKGVESCHKAGIPVTFNVCLMKAGFYNGEFEKIMDRAKEFGAVLIQLINPKPAGAWLESGADKFTEADIKKVKELVGKYNHSKEYKDYPAISAQIIEEDREMYGCTAGGTDRFYINAKGDVQPCEFLNISFGNVLEEDFQAIYERMRTNFKDPGECWLCQKYSGDINNIFKQNNLKALPLNKELSKQIYEKWDRGKKTDLYDRLGKL